MTDRVAFALAGLGGFNAHGAGFLQAARNNQYEPDLITATSGQIIVLAAYLNGASDLRAGLIDPAQENNPLAQVGIALQGYKGVFRPAYPEAVARLFSLSWSGKGLNVLADLLLPAQLYAPTRTDKFVDGLVTTFNSSKTGVVFNGYDPVAGIGSLYGNPAARALMDTRSNVPLLPGQVGHDSRTAKTGKSEEKLLDIDREAVKSALWLSLYGFEGIPNGKMDGAYHRSCNLSELHSFDRVIVVRPLANGWGKSKLPMNYFDVQDWNTEM